MSSHQAGVAQVKTEHQRPDLIPLSFAQERLWLLDRIEGSVHYHMPTLLRFEGPIDERALHFAFIELVNRHEVLRTIFGQVEGTIVQKINPLLQLYEEGKSSLLDQEIVSEQSAFLLDEAIDALVNQAFDLSKDLPLRAKWFQLSQTDHLLVLVFHHIASDGWSQPIFVRELSEYYFAYLEKRTPKLAPLAIQYADYAIQQRQVIKDEGLEERLKYWESKLGGVSPVDLPTDFTRSQIIGNEGEVYKTSIGKRESRALKILAKKERVTLFMLLLSAFKVLLHKYTSQEDICVGTTIANRAHAQVEPLIGFFVNSLALRSQLSSEMSFRNLLKQVKTTTLDAYQMR
ncbi:MAG: condensation domain-containing protein, partial [Bacteroidota bacterium]